MVSPTPAETARLSHSERVELRKAVLSAFMGTVVEWYDFFLYGTAAALVFPHLFFPDSSPQSGTMKSFATYAVGFVGRPIGSIVFGHLGDKLGRKVTLVWTLSLMGGATFLIGCLPSYATAGVIAPILLVVLRFGQGLAIGGEWGGAALLAVEHGHKRSRGWYGSFAQIGVPFGMLLANAVFALMALGGDSFLLGWGWRLSFWFGIVLTIIGLVIRKRVSETPLFQKATRTGAVARNPLGEVLRTHWRKVLTVIGTRVAENAGFFVFSVFALSYADAHLPGMRNTVLYALLCGAALEGCVVPLLGALSDRWGRRAVLMAGNGLYTVGIFWFFWALDTRSPVLIWLAMLSMVGVVHSAMYAPQAAFFAELFPTHLRYSGASLGYGLATPLAGGLAPLISTYLVDKGDGAPWLCAGYLAILGAISFLTVAFARETHSKDISTE